MRYKQTVDILGTKYQVRYKRREDDEHLSADEYMDGYTDYSTKKIVICIQETENGCMDNLEAYQDQVLRHEIVHAFLFESGLHVCSNWASNEEIVDWIAIQMPKMFDVIERLHLLTLDALDLGWTVTNVTLKEAEDDKD